MLPESTSAGDVAAQAFIANGAELGVIAAVIIGGGAVAERRVFAASPVWRKTVRPNAT